jgi:hypothetical protein
MNDLLSGLKNANRNLLIIGTTPITDPEHWKVIKDIIFKKIDNANLYCKFIIESDNQLFQKSLRTDTKHSNVSRVTFTQLKFQRELIAKEINKNEKRKKQVILEISNLTLPINVVAVDDDIWYLPSTGYLEKIERFKLLTTGDIWYEMLRDYIVRLKDKEKDGRYLSIPGKELLELFDQDRIPRGIFPRDCFYDTDHYQFVVWGFVFSRKGELLIHQRLSNAKDNQGMWDKSIGGHVDFKKERSSSIAAVRELIEELYTAEKKQQTGHEFSLLIEDIDKVYNLGEWRSDGRDGEYLVPICQLEEGTKEGEEPWVFYKIHGGSIERNTPRILPNGVGERKLRVLVDVFLFIANTQLSNHESLETLKNSDFQLIEPALLKTWIETGKDDHGNDFTATPDLNFIMSGKLRDIIDEVTQLIKYSDIRK